MISGRMRCRVFGAEGRYEFVEDLRVSEIPELFRVETFYNIVTLLLAQKAKEEDVSPVAATSQERAVI